MSFKEAMGVMLPPKNGKTAKDNKAEGYFGARRKRTKIKKGKKIQEEGIHEGVDFNYGGVGQAGINLTHPPVYSPVNGKIDFTGGSFGIVKIIEDETGYIHRILHLNEINSNIKKGVKVKKGDAIGTMGNMGVEDQHVHYEVRKPNNDPVDPIKWWNQQDLAQQQHNHPIAEKTAQPIKRSVEQNYNKATTLHKTGQQDVTTSTAGVGPEQGKQRNTLTLLDFLLNKQLKLPAYDISAYLPQIPGIQPQQIAVEEFYVINNQPEFEITVPAGTTEQQLTELRNTAKLMTQDAEQSLRTLVNGEI